MAAVLHRFFFLFWAMFLSGAASVQESVPRSVTESDVIRELMARDVKYGIPQYGGHFVVKLGFYIEAVTEVNIERGTMEVVGFLSLQWSDPRLRFEYSDPFNKVKDVRMPREAVWTPDIEMYTQVSPGMQMLNVARDQVLVEFNGTVKWYPMVSLRTLCADLHYNATQVKCSLKLGSWTYHSHLLDVTYNQPGSALAHYVPTGRWTVKEATGERVAVKYDCCDDTYVFINITLLLSKRDI